jgi:hypothetical protein
VHRHLLLHIVDGMVAGGAGAPSAPSRQALGLADAPGAPDRARPYRARACCSRTASAWAAAAVRVSFACLSFACLTSACLSSACLSSARVSSACGGDTLADGHPDCRT